MIELPPFSKENLNPHLINPDLESAFQNFTFDALAPDLPGLILLPTAGKDGGIDLFQDLHNCRTVVQCKVIGEDGLKPAQQRWQEFSSLLINHISSDVGPSKGQAQYEPWFRKDFPITRFIFCISSSLSNVRQRDTLNAEINAFFSHISTTYPHLAHLKSLESYVIDRLEFSTISRKFPLLRFRWFPQSTPLGFELLEEFDRRTTSSGLSSFLGNDRLPYFSYSDYAAISPPNYLFELPTPQTILKHLENEDDNGVILAGLGGIGKSRLMLESGRLAQKSNWSVFTINERFEIERLETLARTSFEPGERILLLVDYAELQSNITRVSGLITELNLRLSTRIRLLVTCRSSYFANVADLLECRAFEISTDTSSIHKAWHDGYRHATVEHILQHAGVCEPELLTICVGIPVLAVFLAYLKFSGRDAELEEIRGEKYFVRWLTKRLTLLTGDGQELKALPLLVANFPINERDVGTVELDLVTKMLQDGWVERRPHLTSDGAVEFRLHFIHDVFADQILEQAFSRKGAQAAPLFTVTLLNTAIERGTLTSCLMALNRIAPSIQRLNVDWRQAFDTSIARHKTAWEGSGIEILRHSLLNFYDRLLLFDKYFDVWGHQLSNSEFQTSIGYNTRRYIQAGHNLDEILLKKATHWIESSISTVGASNYALNCGILIDPLRFRESAYKWLIANYAQFQAHYTIVFWLRADLPPDEIESVVKSWASLFPANSHLSFVFGAWLKARGNLEVIEDFLPGWLAAHGEATYARFLYHAWLNAGGNPLRIRPHIANWLYQHGETPEAITVYTAWLDASADTELVEPHLMGWLNAHGADIKAEFVIKSWLDAGGELDLVRCVTLGWLTLFEDTLEAGYIYQAWLDAGGDSNQIKSSAINWLGLFNSTLEAEFIIKAWLDAGGDPQDVKPNIEHWLTHHADNPKAEFVYKGWLDAGGDIDFIRPFVQDWLETHSCRLDAGYIYQSWIDAGCGIDSVATHVHDWLHLFGEEKSAGHVYRAWFAGGGKSEIVERHLDGWLNKFAADQEACYVLKAALDGGNTSMVLDKRAVDWIQAHHESLISGFILRSWIAAGKEIKRIEPWVLRWLSIHADQDDAEYVLKNWLEKGGDWIPISTFAETWFEYNIDNPNSTYLLKHIVKARLLSDHLIHLSIAWINKHPGHVDAMMRLGKLVVRNHNSDFAGPLLSASQSVLEASGNTIRTGHPYLRNAPLFIVIGIIRNKIFHDHPNRLFANKVVYLWISTFNLKESPPDWGIIRGRSNLVLRLAEILSCIGVSDPVAKLNLRSILESARSWAGEEAVFNTKEFRYLAGLLR